MNGNATINGTLFANSLSVGATSASASNANASVFRGANVGSAGIGVATTEGFLYSAGFNSTHIALAAYNTTTQALIWSNISAYPSSFVTHHKVLAYNGSGYILGSNGTFSRIERRNLTNGNLIWNITTTIEQVRDMAIYNGSLYLGTFNNSRSYMMRRSLNDGAMVNLSAQIASSSTILVANGTGGAYLLWSTGVTYTVYGYDSLLSQTFTATVNIDATQPWGFAADHGNVYIANQNTPEVSTKIFAVDTARGSTYCNSTFLYLASSNSISIATTNDGFWVSDGITPTTGTRAYKFPPGCGTPITNLTFGGTGSASFNTLAVTSNGTVYGAGRNSTLNITIIESVQNGTAYRGLTVTSAGLVGIGTKTPGATLDVNGSIRANGAITQNVGQDVAEAFSGDEPLSAGELVVATGEETVAKATQATAHLIIGAVSTKPGFLLDKEGLTNKVFIGLAGRIPVKVQGTIEQGDFITVGPTPGVGVRATEAGFVIGRAIGPVRPDGTVMIIIQPYYFNPAVNAQGKLVGGESKKLQFSDRSAAGEAVKGGKVIGAPIVDGAHQRSGNDVVVSLGGQKDVVITLG